MSEATDHFSSMSRRLSNAEKQRLYRLRRDSDPERRNAHLLKKKQKYERDKREGKRKLIKDMSERGKRSQRREWRQRKQRSRKNQHSATPADQSEIADSTLDESACSR